MAKRDCPLCGKPASAEATPFCSKRCADADLGNWITGRYSVPVVEHDDLPDENDGEIEVKQ